MLIRIQIGKSPKSTEKSVRYHTSEIKLSMISLLFLAFNKDNSYMLMWFIMLQVFKCSCQVKVPGSIKDLSFL